MRGYDPSQEAAFFRLFQDYYNLEHNTNRTFGQGLYTLERMSGLAIIAGNPERHLRLLHVAGTKGKGTTCFFLGALLNSAGFSCGVYSSPHLATVRERFQIDRQLISYDVLLRTADELEAELRQHRMTPTLFEIMTVLGLKIFADSSCDYAIIETGIGGLLDATNFIESPRCCIITPVSFDHTQILGNTIKEIAAQKAGIIKPGVPVVCARQPYSEAEEVIRAVADARGAPFYFAPDQLLPGPEWPLAELPSFLADNFRTALCACRVLGLRPEPSRFHWPELRGRFECLRRTPLVIIDAAHNADSAEKLVAGLQEKHPGTSFVTVLGITEGKDVDGIFSALNPVTSEFTFTNPANAAKGSELDHLIRLGCESGAIFRIMPEIRTTDVLPSDRPLLFTGSFFTALIGERLFTGGSPIDCGVIHGPDK